MKKLLIFSFLFSTSLLIANNNVYLFNVADNLKANIKNKSTVEVPIPKAGVQLCSISLTNLVASGSWGASLNRISFIEHNDQNYDFGNTTYNSRTSATFDNGTISSNSTYSNGSFYYIKYALSGYENGTPSGANGYWMANGGTRTVTITFNNQPYLKGMYMADRTTCSPDCRGTRTTYYINLYSCDNSLIKTIPITNRLSLTTGATGYVSFEEPL